MSIKTTTPVTDSERLGGKLPDNYGIPIGSGIEFWGNTAPEGFLFANGSAISRTTYADLFAKTGTVYGAGDGSTTFNLPDKRSRVSVMQSTDTEFSALGKKGGDKNMQQHTHTQTAHTHTQSAHTHQQNTHAHGTNAHDHKVKGWAFGVDGTGGGDIMALRQSTTDNWANRTDAAGVTVQAAYADLLKTTVSNAKTTAINSNTGTGTAQNLQPYLVCNYIIKY